MVSWLVFVIAVVYFLWKIQHTISSIKQEAFEKVEQVIVTNKGKIAGVVSATVLTFLGNKVRSLFKK